MPAGRRQYRYHPDFRAKQDAGKYADCLEFGKALPKIRRQVDKDLKRKALDKQRVVAAVVRLLDEEKIRVGNAQYARDNKSYGATTLLSPPHQAQAWPAEDAFRRKARHRP